MLSRLYTLIVKEMIIIWSNPRTRYALLIPPIIQLVIFVFAATLDVKNVTLGILNEDRGNEGYRMTEYFQDSILFTKIVHLQSQQQISNFIDQQEGLLVLYIPQEFSKKLMNKESAPLQILLDGRKSNASQIVLGYSQDIITSFARSLGATEKITIAPRYWYNPNLWYHWYNVASLTCVLAMLTCLIVTSISIAREKEMGTFSQLLVSPLTPFEVLLGKIIPGIIVGMLEGALILFVGILLFQVPFTGSFLSFFCSLFVFVSAISGIGLFISTLCATQQQAILGSFLFISPSVILAGYATPIENMPSWLQPVTYFVPLRYMLIISKGSFFKAMPPIHVIWQLWPMALIASGTLLGAGLFFRKRLD